MSAVRARFRAEAVRRELATMRTLADRYGVPAFLAGDLNERTKVFCRLSVGGALTSPAGGSHAGRCASPRYSGIDWIFRDATKMGRVLSREDTEADGNE